VGACPTKWRGSKGLSLHLKGGWAKLEGPIGVELLECDFPVSGSQRFGERCKLPYLWVSGQRSAPTTWPIWNLFRWNFPGGSRHKSEWVSSFLTAHQHIIGSAQDPQNQVSVESGPLHRYGISMFAGLQITFTLEGDHAQLILGAKHSSLCNCNVFGRRYMHIAPHCIIDDVEIAFRYQCSTICYT